MKLIKHCFQKIYSNGDRASIKINKTPKYDCLLFDLDDTLYPYSSGIEPMGTSGSQLLLLCSDYMVDKLGIEESKIPDMCNVLYKHYGTTIDSFSSIGYNFDYDDYHSFVHGRLPYDKLKPDPVFRHLLLSLPIRKVIFTNADKVHAAKVLSKLGLEDCFEGIICFETLNPPTDLSSPSDAPATADVFDILKHFSQPDAGFELPKIFLFILLHHIPFIDILVFYLPLWSRQLKLLQM
uniref:Uncharacterized protein C24B11.05-like n=1 Tax=Elaeis guineensis var. tenera TaxID=51953 RepID=A0A6J0PQH0_ELAGV|nr:uncharacterized protein C24B11.05-like [Elaeis guineensis]